MADTPRSGGPSSPIPFAQALRFWLKLGFISFGGPAGQIAIMHRELVERRRWISEGRFLHALGYTMVLPGPEAQQLATYVGWLLHGPRGGIAAGVLFILPSLALFILLGWAYLAYAHLPWVDGALYGVKPAVVAVVAFAAYRLGRRALRTPALWAVAAAAFVAIAWLDVYFPYIVIGAGVLGAIGARLAPAQFRTGDPDTMGEPTAAGAILDDRDPTPDHARPHRGRLLRHGSMGVALWAAALGGLTAAFGWSGTLTQMGWFFTKVALVTFGGAYAVLPYVFQAAVEYHGWVTAAQMLDGLALGESTPGPLIMVVAFVAYLGAATADAPAWAGPAAAGVATLFTFLPSFLFILLGAPLVEATRSRPAFTGPLSGITAAVVGVILNLAVFFAYHVLWPDGLGAGMDGFTALVMLIAALALFLTRLGIIPVLAAAAMTGLIHTALGGPA